VNYILKGTNDLYQRIAELKGTGASIILPLNFPAAMDVEDPNDARIVALADMKHWEMALSTSNDRKSRNQFCFNYCWYFLLPTIF
jgi:hypothetical protein